MKNHSISVMTVWKWKKRFLNKEPIQNVMVFSKISESVKENAECLAEIMGISLSEYIRHLIINDLDERGIITMMLKEA